MSSFLLLIHNGMKFSFWYIFNQIFHFLKSFANWSTKPIESEHVAWVVSSLETLGVSNIKCQWTQHRTGPFWRVFCKWQWKKEYRKTNGNTKALISHWAVQAHNWGNLAFVQGFCPPSGMFSVQEWVKDAEAGLLHFVWIKPEIQSTFSMTKELFKKE